MELMALKHTAPDSGKRSVLSTAVQLLLRFQIYIRLESVGLESSREKVCNVGKGSCLLSSSAEVVHPLVSFVCHCLILLLVQVGCFILVGEFVGCSVGCLVGLSVPSFVGRLVASHGLIIGMLLVSSIGQFVASSVGPLCSLVSYIRSSSSFFCSRLWRRKPFEFGEERGVKLRCKMMLLTQLKREVGLWFQHRRPT